MDILIITIVCIFIFLPMGLCLYSAMGRLNNAIKKEKDDNDKPNTGGGFLYE